MNKLACLLGAGVVLGATLSGVSALGASSVRDGSVLAGPPVAAKKPVVDEYHGTKVTDDYRWLENWDDPAVKAWSEGQNAYARSILDKIPFRGAVADRLRQLEEGASIAYTGLACRGGQVFALKHDPHVQQPMLVVMQGTDPKSERTIVDPNAMDKSGHTAIDWFKVSRDGTMAAVSMSHGGSESGDVHVFDTKSGKEADGVVPRVNGGTAGGSLAWAPDGSGFFYTRYPRAGERPEEDLNFWMQVYWHKLGTPTEKDTYELGKDFPKIAEIQLEGSKSGEVLASVQKGDGGEFMHWVRKDGTWTRVTKWEDRVVCATLGDHDDLFMVSLKKSPHGEVLHTALAKGLAGAQVFVPPVEDAVIETNFESGTGLLVTDNILYVWYQVGGPNEVRKFAVTDGHATGRIDSPPVSTVAGVVDAGGGKVLYNCEGFIAAPAWYEMDSKGASHRTALAQDTPAACEKMEVVREFAKSKDGTKVPISIIRPKGSTLDGNSATIVYGYGGYGVNMTPTFSPRRLVWVEQGCVFAVANIRGGGEFGEEWHRQGNLTHKQNVFDDFTAAARHMIEAKYTNHDRMAIMGGSNGGLLMGAVMTQHPDLCKACASAVGIYDMLRVERSPNGAFNVTEFGTVRDEEQFKALYAYSPYHHVTDGTSYPATIFTTGANDPRVDPMQSRKFVAELQAADPKGMFLLRTSMNAGHGIGSSLDERVNEWGDIYAFLFSELSVPYKSGK